MFNKERKIEFLALKSKTAINGGNLERGFKEAEKFEERKNKDLCNWNSKDILEFYKYIGTENVQTLIVLHNALLEYTKWCMINGLVKDNQNHYEEISNQSLCNCIDLYRLSKRIISREDLLNSISDLPNYCDRFIFLGLFEGIPVKDNALINVKLSDLDGNILHLSNGNDLKISDELVHIMYQANEERTYQSLGGKREFDYLPSNNIIRPLDPTKLRGSTSNPILIIGSRIRRCSKYMGYDFTIKNIIESGRINYIKEIMEKYNISVNKAITEPKYKKMYENIYGHIQSTSVYLKTFGKILENIK
jgi:hypothetical protein